jgi:hypothetical protein
VVARRTEAVAALVREATSAAGEGRHGGDSEAQALREAGALLVASAQSILPPPEKRARRRPVLDWPLPSQQLTEFERVLREQEFPLFGATRFLFAQTHAAHALAQKAEAERTQRAAARVRPGDSGSGRSGSSSRSSSGSTGAAAAFAAMSPDVASVVSRCMVDAYWAVFYSTGDGRAISRVVDAAVPYVEFAEEYGDRWVAHFGKETLADPNTGREGPNRFNGVPEEFEDDPLNRMKFEVSRYALWSLLTNARTHTVVSEVFMKEFGLLSDRYAMSDPQAREDEWTPFFRDRLDLMSLVQPSVAAMGAEAGRLGGIGSGEWPATYRHPGEPIASVGMASAAEASGRLLAAGSSHHNAEAIESAAAASSAEGLADLSGGGWGSGLSIADILNLKQAQQQPQEQ